MKKQVIAATTTLALCMGASGAMAQEWTGLYIGGLLGESNLKSTWHDQDGDWGPAGQEVGRFDNSNTALGLQLGYNWQAGNIVYGIAGGFSFQDVTNTTFVYNDVDLENSLYFAADVRGVLGYAFGDLLPYATFGVAIGDLEHSWLEIDDTADSWPDFDNRDALVYGLGVEYALSKEVSLGLQYLRYDFGTETDRNPLGYSMEVETEMDRTALTANYHF